MEDSLLIDGCASDLGKSLTEQKLSHPEIETLNRQFDKNQLDFFKSIFKIMLSQNRQPIKKD